MKTPFGKPSGSHGAVKAILETRVYARGLAALCLLVANEHHFLQEQMQGPVKSQERIGFSCPFRTAEFSDDSDSGLKMLHMS